MSDNTETPDEPTVEPATVDTADETVEGRVPLDRFRAVTDENKTLRAQVDELAAWKNEQEQASLSELERERQAREQAEAKAAEATDKAIRLERSRWVNNAASAAGFADPDDASLLLDLATIEDEAAAADLVKALAERKPHLLREAHAQPQPMGSPLATPAAVSDDPKQALGAELLGVLKRSR